MIHEEKGFKKKGKKNTKKNFLSEAVGHGIQREMMKLRYSHTHAWLYVCRLNKQV